MKGKSRNIFVSHVHENDGRLPSLKSLAAKHGGKIRDYSVNSDKPNRANNPKYIWDKHIKPRLDKCKTLAVLITPDMTRKNSPWVEKEILYAHKEGKKIVGIWDHGKREDVPHGLDELADSIVDWNGERLVEALFSDKEVFCDEDGGGLPPRNPVRHSC